MTAGTTDPNEWRKDECGAWIAWAHYGDHSSQFGWEVDRIKSVEGGGGEELSNLRPLHWRNIAAKQDGSLVCGLSASGQLG